MERGICEKNILLLRGHLSLSSPSILPKWRGPCRKLWESHFITNGNIVTDAARKLKKPEQVREFVVSIAPIIIEIVRKL